MGRATQHRFDPAAGIRRSPDTLAPARANNIGQQSEESQPPAVVAPVTHYTRVLDARAYLGWRAEIAIHRISIASGRYGDAAQKLADWKRMIGRLVRGGFSEKKYGLPRKRFFLDAHRN